MTPIKTTEEYLGNMNLTNKQLEEIRDVVDILAETIVQGHRDKKHHERKNKNRGD